MKTAQNHNIDISQQRSRPINSGDLEDFDQIYCMDLSVYEDVISLAKSEKQRLKISLFLQEADMPINNYEVFDPYWSEMDGFEKVFKLLDDASERIKAKLLNPNS